MLNPAHLIANALGEELVGNYRDMFGDRQPEYAAILRATSKLVVERIANSDALYHDSHHTVMVTLVGQAILKGRILVEQVDAGRLAAFHGGAPVSRPRLSARHLPGRHRPDLRHRASRAGSVRAPRGASDAFLTPFHIERGKIFVRHRCAAIEPLDAERIARAIELTRFPVPADNDHAETDTEAGLVRAADLIGQLADPFYSRKLNALYHEFVETGVAQRLGYGSPADLAEHYPRFFWQAVEPYIGDALQHLSRTVEGKQWIANLYAHVFAEEHRRERLGPQRGD